MFASGGRVPADKLKCFPGLNSLFQSVPIGCKLIDDRLRVVAGILNGGENLLLSSINHGCRFVFHLHSDEIRHLWL